MRRWSRLASAGVALSVVVSATACSGGGGGDKASSGDIVVGVPKDSTTTTRRARVIPAPDPLPADLFVEGEGYSGNRAEPTGGRGLTQPDGQPWPAPIQFTSAADVPPDLIFVLVAGSDARPKENLLKTRADSIHLVAVNPSTGQGTLLGLPRDSWVEIPGKGRGKINNALALGGPDLLAATVRRTTGLPVDYYVITGFAGLVRMVDDLGGVDVQVQRRMNDRASGALFERGWHHFDGREALAFARNRNDVANGDFSRSGNQGVLMLAALAKMRAEVGDDEGLTRWIEVMLRHVKLDVPVSALPGLAALARNLDPARLTNVVAPGRIGKASGQSVVFLTKSAITLFDDIRADGVVGGATAPPVQPVAATTTSGPSTPATAASQTPLPTTTTAPAAPASTTTTTTSPGLLPLPGAPPDDSDEEEGEEDGDSTTTPEPDEDETTTTTGPDEETTTTTGDEDADESEESTDEETGDNGISGGGRGGGGRGGRGG